MVFWEQVESVELDDMRGFVQNKGNQRWPWLAIGHSTHAVLAYPFGITTTFSDDWGSYERNLEPGQLVIGKKNTQAIERKNLTLRTRIKGCAAEQSL